MAEVVVGNKGIVRPAASDEETDKLVWDDLVSIIAK